MSIGLDFYNEYLISGIVKHDFPSEITLQYEVKACLKMTECKQVYLVTSRTNWRKYILKTVEIRCQENLEDEYRLIKSLSHPGIVSACQFVKGDKFNYLIREYIEGNTITEILEMTEEGHLSNDELMRITIQISDILQYLHGQTPPIIHRDIKPDNIIITKGGECKLIDFGTSRRLQEGAQSDTVILGTQLLAPPEQYGYAQTDSRSDIYALGILMFYMATGSYQINELQQYQIEEKTLKIIKKCTRFSPKERYSSINHLKNKLVGFPYNIKNRRLICTGSLGLFFLAAVAGGFIWGLKYNTFTNNKLDVADNIQQYNTESSLVALAPTLQPSQTPIDQAENNLLTAKDNLEVVNENQALSKEEISAGEKEESAGQKEVSGSQEDVIMNQEGEKESTQESVTLDSTNGGISVSADASNNAKDVVIPFVVPESESTEVINSDNEKEYKFKSTKIEAAVRNILHKSQEEPVTYEELKKIDSLYICGQQIYDDWGDHFVYGANQYMIGSKYKAEIYQTNGEITTIEDLSYMPNLKQLALYNQRIRDISPLEKLYSLTYLGIGSNNIDDLEPLLELPWFNI